MGQAQLPFDLLRRAALGERGEEQKLIALEGIQLIELLLRKNADYAGSVFREPFLLPGLEADAAILVRMSDKTHRINALMQRPPEVTSESLCDTMRDLGGYSVLWLVCQRLKTAAEDLLPSRLDNSPAIPVAQVKPLDHEVPAPAPAPVYSEMTIEQVVEFVNQCHGREAAARKLGISVKVLATRLESYRPKAAPKPAVPTAPPSYGAE